MKAACNSPISRRPKAATASTRNSFRTGRRQGGGPAARGLSFRLLVPSLAGGNGLVRKKRAEPTPKRLPPVLDVEATPTSPTCRRHLEREQTLQDIKAMLVEMERFYGKKPIIYTTVDFYEAIHRNALGEYPIWICSTKHRPSVKYGDRAWHFWQYQSDGWVQGHPHPRRPQRFLRRHQGLADLAANQWFRLQIRTVQGAGNKSLVLPSSR